MTMAATDAVPTPRLHPVTIQEHVLAALFGLVVAGGAVWGAWYVLGHLWQKQIDLFWFASFTLKNLDDAAALYSEYWTLQSIGFQHYLVALAAVAILAWAGPFAFGSQRPAGATLKATAIGAVAGTAAGYAAGFIPSLFISWTVLAPAGGTLAIGAIAAILTPPRLPDPVVRGTRVNKTVRRRRSAVDEALRHGWVVFANEPVHPNDEATHFVAEGASGTGKTTVTKALLATAIARGDQMVVADPSGEFTGHFHRDGDVILNPFDGRCAKWCLFSDIREDTDHERMAAALLPYGGNAESRRWTDRGRELLATMMRAYRQLDAGGSDDFAHFLRTATPEMMGELCEGTESATLFDEGNERLRGSVLTELSAATKFLSRMAMVEGEPFSIRDWTTGGRGRLWLPYRINQLDSLRSAIGSWVGIAAMEVMSMEPSRTRRVWFVVDELDMLGRVPDLEKGLTNGRRYGACFAIGFQSISQLRETYGNNVAATIEENIATKLILRCEGFGQDGTAEHASRMIGEQEKAFEDVTTSASPGSSQGGGVAKAVRHRIERAVLASEISQLPNLTGYLKRPGDAGWQKVVVPVRDYPAADPKPEAA